MSPTAGRGAARRCALARALLKEIMTGDTILPKSFRMFRFTHGLYERPIYFLVWNDLDRRFARAKNSYKLTPSSD
jgi:hypothetical protein